MIKTILVGTANSITIYPTIVEISTNPVSLSADGTVGEPVFTFANRPFTILDKPKVENEITLPGQFRAYVNDEWMLVAITDSATTLSTKLWRDNSDGSSPPSSSLREVVVFRPQSSLFNVGAITTTDWTGNATPENEYLFFFATPEDSAITSIDGVALNSLRKPGPVLNAYDDVYFRTHIRLRATITLATDLSTPTMIRAQTNIAWAGNDDANYAHTFIHDILATDTVTTVVRTIDFDYSDPLHLDTESGIWSAAIYARLKLQLNNNTVAPSGWIYDVQYDIVDYTLIAHIKQPQS